MPSQAKKALEEAGYQPPENATEKKRLDCAAANFEDKLPSEVIAALPTKPTLGPVEEGREVADNMLRLCAAVSHRRQQGKPPGPAQEDAAVAG